MSFKDATLLLFSRTAQLLQTYFLLSFLSPEKECKKDL